MSESTHGSCACGAVHFVAQADPAAGTMRCTCRGCTKRGWWTLSTPPDGLTVLEGEEHVVIDQAHPDFDRRRCGKCGVLLFGWVGPVEYGGPRFSVNVRTLDLPSWEGIPVTWLDGLHDTWAFLGVEPHREAEPLQRARSAG
ncbi:MAG: aldehyde-activating protein [Myxococcota bacterium]